MQKPVFQKPVFLKSLNWTQVLCEEFELDPSLCEEEFELDASSCETLKFSTFSFLRSLVEGVIAVSLWPSIRSNLPGPSECSQAFAGVETKSKLNKPEQELGLTVFMFFLKRYCRTFFLKMLQTLVNLRQTVFQKLVNLRLVVHQTFVHTRPVWQQMCLKTVGLVLQLCMCIQIGLFTSQQFLKPEPTTHEPHEGLSKEPVERVFESPAESSVEPCRHLCSKMLSLNAKERSPGPSRNKSREG